MDFFQGIPLENNIDALMFIPQALEKIKNDDDVEVLIEECLRKLRNVVVEDIRAIALSHADEANRAQMIKKLLDDYVVTFMERSEKNMEELGSKLKLTHELVKQTQEYQKNKLEHIEHNQQEILRLLTATRYDSFDYKQLANELIGTHNDEPSYRFPAAKETAQGTTGLGNMFLFQDSKENVIYHPPNDDISQTHTRIMKSALEF